VEHPTLHGLRILSLNTIFWSARYRQFSRWLCSGQFHGPGRSAELAEAEQSHEKVWLMFHIPPGIDGWATTHHRDGADASCSSSNVPMWVPEWTARFDHVLER
jgi:hypothetical protein